jgi:hypothetical protein
MIGSAAGAAGWIRTADAGRSGAAGRFRPAVVVVDPVIS